MIEIRFSYRAESICLAASDERDAILTIVQRFQTFYEVDVLERCEFYVRRLGKAGGTIVDVGAHIGNHAVFFAKFCHADRVVAFEPFRLSFEALTETIRRNGLKNVRAYNLALGGRRGWGTMAICDPTNLGANRVEPSMRRHSNAVPITPLDAICGSIDSTQTPLSLMKIDVEGMECEVIEGAMGTLRRHRPILCIEILDGTQMRRMIGVLAESLYLVRECNGAAPTYILTWEPRIPRAITRTINYGWLLLAHLGNSAMRWRYRRVIEILLPTRRV